MTNYKRNALSVKKEILKNSSGQYVCKSRCRIHTPLRFVEKGLSEVGLRTYLFGSFPIIIENNDYAVLNVCGKVEIKPSKTTMISMEETDYYEFQFEAGDVLIASDQIVQDDKILYFILDELIFQAKVPWYLGYDDLGKILDSTKQFAGSNAAEVLETIEVLASIVTRIKSDPEVYARLKQDVLKDFGPDNVQFIPLSSVHLSVAGTANRIAGSYFEPAVEGALVTPSKKSDDVEKILRA